MEYGDYKSQFGVTCHEVEQLVPIASNCLNRELSTDPSGVYMFAVTRALSLASTAYAADGPSKKVRRKFLDRNSTRIARQIRDARKLPALYTSYGPDTLLDDEIIMIGMIGSIGMRGINIESILAGINCLLSKGSSLGNFSVRAFSNQEMVTASDCIRMLIDALIRSKSPHMESSVGYEIYELYRGGNVTANLEPLSGYLQAKWEKGLLLFGRFPTEEQGTLTVAAVLPESVLR